MLVSMQDAIHMLEVNNDDLGYSISVTHWPRASEELRVKDKPTTGILALGI